MNHDLMLALVNKLIHAQGGAVVLLPHDLPVSTTVYPVGEAGDEYLALTTCNDNPDAQVGCLVVCWTPDEEYDSLAYDALLVHLPDGRQMPSTLDLDDVESLREVFADAQMAGVRVEVEDPDEDDMNTEQYLEQIFLPSVKKVIALLLRNLPQVQEALEEQTLQERRDTLERLLELEADGSDR